MKIMLCFALILISTLHFMPATPPEVVQNWLHWDRADWILAQFYIFAAWLVLMGIICVRGIWWATAKLIHNPEVPQA